MTKIAPRSSAWDTRPQPQPGPASPQWGALAGFLICTLGLAAMVYGLYRALEFLERIYAR